MLATRVALLIWLIAAAAHAAVPIPVGGQPNASSINPVTNQIFVRNGGAFANVLTRLDLATHATATVTLPGNVGALAIDVLRNRVYANVGGTQFVAIEGASLAVTPFSLPAGGGLSLDAGANRLYLVVGSGVHVVDGATLTSQFVPFGSGVSSWGGAAVDPLEHTLHAAVRFTNEFDEDACAVQRIGGDPPAVLDSREVGIANLQVVDLRIDPFRRRTFSFDAFLFNRRMARVDWSNHTLVTAYLPETYTTYLVDLAAARVWRWDPATGGARMDGDTLLTDGVGAAGSTDGGWALNPATRRHYANVAPPEDPRFIASVDLDTGAQLPIPGSDTNETGAIGVNPATSRLYRLEGAATIVEYDELVATPVPMPTAITPGAPSPSGEVTVEFTASSDWAPVAHPIRRIYYQVDAVDGPWLPASPPGGTAVASITGLAPGAHTIYALATDGQESPIQSLHTVLTGPIASAEIVVPAPPACANGSDDDGDGLADFPADPGCRDAVSTLEDPRCDDDLDNDGDGKIDWDGGAGAGTPDPQCAASHWRNTEATACGLGAEVAALVAAVLVLRRRPI